MKKWLSGTETPADKGLSLPTEYVVYPVRYPPNPAKGIVVTHRIRCLPGSLPAEDGEKDFVRHPKGAKGRNDGHQVRHPNLPSAPWRGKNLSPKLGVRPVERGERRIRHPETPSDRLYVSRQRVTVTYLLVREHPS